LWANDEGGPRIEGWQVHTRTCQPFFLARRSGFFLQNRPARRRIVSKYDGDGRIRSQVYYKGDGAVANKTTYEHDKWGNAIKTLSTSSDHNGKIVTQAMYRVITYYNEK
jgi:hypothetical protein